MTQNEVSNRRAHGMLRAAVNNKVINSCKDVFQNYKDYLTDKTAGYKTIDQIYLTTVDPIVKPNINRYLGQTSLKDQSSKLAAMGGGNMFQIFRIYRDIIYTQQNRKARLLHGIRGTLRRAKMNKVADEVFL